VPPNPLQQSFEKVAEHGDEVPLFFYSYLFLRHPETRGMFPPGMAAQRDRLVGALARIVSGVTELESVVPFVEQLGRDHRKFSVVPEHYPAVGEALLATLKHFLGTAWTSELAADWTAAFGVVSEVMIKAAEAEEFTPAYWHAEITDHQRRGPDLAVITVAPESPIPYLPGQSVSVQTPQRPRLWRFYSPANAPREDGGIEFHVRALDGGWVSSALVLSASVGDVLQLGPPVGELTLDTESDADLLMLAGGSGLAPLRAIVEQALADRSRPSRRVHLFHEARTERDLYDLPLLDRLAAADPRLIVVPVARTGPVSRAAPGRAVDAALRSRRWGDHDVYVCGSSDMVGYTTEVLVQAGLDTRLRYESFGYRVSLPSTTPSGAAAPGSDPA
jgi:NAD(P)H-flavin reductase/hemoglobin-like flavoprotein